MNWFDKRRRRKAALERLNKQKEFKRGYEAGVIAIRSCSSSYGFEQARTYMRENIHNHPYCLGVAKAIEDEKPS